MKSYRIQDFYNENLHCFRIDSCTKLNIEWNDGSGGDYSSGGGNVPYLILDVMAENPKEALDKFWQAKNIYYTKNYDKILGRKHYENYINEIREKNTK